MINTSGEPIGPPPDPRAAGISTIDYCKLLPKRRWDFTAKGRLLFFPRSGMVLVPYEPRGRSWSCVVVVGNEAGTYTPSGYSLDVCNEEIETAIEIDLTEKVYRAWKWHEGTIGQQELDLEVKE